MINWEEKKEKKYEDKRIEEKKKLKHEKGKRF